MMNKITVFHLIQSLVEFKRWMCEKRMRMLLNDTGKKNFGDGEVAPDDANKVTWDLWDFVGFEGFSFGMVGFMWDFRIIPKCSFLYI
jgi:hypothetical protein